MYISLLVIYSSRYIEDRCIEDSCGCMGLGHAATREGLAHDATQKPLLLYMYIGSLSLSL